MQSQQNLASTKPECQTQLRAMRGTQECFKVLKGLLSLPGKCVKDKRASNKDKVGTGKKAGRLMLPSVRV